MHAHLLQPLRASHSPLHLFVFWTGLVATGLLPLLALALKLQDLTPLLVFVFVEEVALGLAYDCEGVGVVFIVVGVLTSVDLD